MENVLSVYRSKLLAHDIAVESRFTDLRKIRVRTGEVVQIFSNVICNAIDSMPHGGTLLIRTARIVRTEGDAIQVVISDTGSGIAREHLDKVFEPFFTTKGNLGTGIGLWVAKQLVERHGGQISISSSTDRGNSGTIVTMTFPFRGAEDEEAGSGREQ